MKKLSTKKKNPIEALLASVVSPESPACEVFSNPWLFREIVGLVNEKPQIEYIMMSGGKNDDCGIFKMMEIFSISTNSWMIGPVLSQSRCDHGMALVDVVGDGDDHSHREIFIIGGRVDDVASNSMISLTIPTNKMGSTMMETMEWKVMPNLKVNRIGPGVGVVDGKIFVIGGYNYDAYLKTIEVFSVQEGKWIDDDSQIPQDMPTVRYAMGVAVIGKKIFVIGGFNHTDGFLSSVEVLDTETNRWSTLPSLKTARCEMGIAVIDDRFIWVLGGFNYGLLDVIEIFDVEKNKWSTPSFKMTSPTCKMKAIAVGHRIFIFGDQRVEVLDVDKLEWSGVPPMRLSYYWSSAIGF